MNNSFLFHCGQKTRVVDTRNAVRIRVCQACGDKFKTQEVLMDFAKPNKQRKLSNCPVTRNALEAMMDEFPSLHDLAGSLGVSDNTLKRWLIKYGL